jgi:competence protein ComEA
MDRVWQRIKWVDGVLVLGILMVAIGIGMDIKQKSGEKVEVTKVRAGPTTSPSIGAVAAGTTKVVVVDIEGEVIRPGVYKLMSGSRVNEVLAAAGGLGARADRDWGEKNLNRAQVIEDGSKVYIPAQNEVVKSGVVAGISQGEIEVESKVVNLNTASLEELDGLPGIGPSIGQKIIDYRNQSGGFKDINEIKLVSGVGEKLFEKIKDKISL